MPESIETKSSRYRLLTPRTSPPRHPGKAASKAASTTAVAQRSPSAHRRHTLHSIPSSPCRPSDARNHVTKARRATLSTLRSLSTPARRPFMTKPMTRLQPQMSRISSAGSDGGEEDAADSPNDSEKTLIPLLQRATSVVVPLQRARKAIRRSFSLAQPPVLFDDESTVSEAVSEVPTLVQPPSNDQYTGSLTQKGDTPCEPLPTQDNAQTPLTLLKAARTRTQTALRKTASSVARVSTRNTGKDIFRRGHCR